MRKVLTAVAGAATLFLPIANAVAAGIQKTKPKHKTATKHAKAKKPKKKHAVTVTKTVTGDLGSAGQWGEVQVTLVVKKTTTTVGKKKTVKRTVTGLKVPVFPDHTDRSVFINQQAIPMLEQEELPGALHDEHLHDRRRHLHEPGLPPVAPVGAPQGPQGVGGRWPTCPAAGASST